MLQKNERDLFQNLTSGDFENFALVEGSFMGNRAAFVACVNKDNEEYIITPLAVLLRSQDLEHCLGPENEPLEGEGGVDVDGAKNMER